ncbi:hypothetical protein A2876_01170 [Candidatus Amesbacteria bacterium RIFCSPHIGHO2_01_FULL_48_32b]|uniref:Uncharacterized protein n=1 Tax=Candidatus Amesbacteria bacterium RIFCSPHIGHO2_01_FULL_48_32b TaxID=1797253 RepID=A0A1F4YGK4_9BACT|nr:MAG: hypothetical protein A2876_01170 [Candidatus Amesbacteria bacterium RIFCSPHIGHO2_01_FULL_48_32b]
MPHLAQISGIYNPTRFTNPTGLPTVFASLLLQYAIIGAGFVFFVQLIMAGFSFLTAAGDPAKIQGATKTLTHALIGLIVVITAFFIAQILEVILGLNIV